MADAVIQFPTDFPLKDNPSYADKLLGYDTSTGKPMKATIESIQAAIAANVIGTVSSTDSPTGDETNGQSYRVTNSTSSDVTYSNFDNAVVTAKSSGYLIKSGGVWKFVKDELNTLSFVPKAEIIEQVSTNMIDEASIDFLHRYSIASKTIINQDSQIAASPRVKVFKGQVFTFSGNGLYIHTDGLPQGGFFANESTTSAIANIAFSASSDGLGWKVVIPEAYDGYYIIVNLNTTADHDFNGYQIMMNKGDGALPYEAYDPVDKIFENLIPKDGDNAGMTEKEVIAISRQKTVPLINVNPIHQRIKPFIIKYLERDKGAKDLEIVLLGDSIFGKTINYTQYSTEEQQTRPATLISKGISSGIWDKINDGCTKFARWDKAGVFTETGSGWTSYFGYALKAIWDDAGDRTAETREFYGTGAASTSFKFDAGNKRLNFVYRTSTEGCDNNVLTITAGDGKILVWDGTNYVEANNFPLSQLYTASGIGYGNTEYGRILKLKKVSTEVDVEHTITISKPVTASAESFMYWGIEQSNRDYIMRIRNVARGGHDMKMLWQYIRTEFDNFDTDLVLFEIPIINMLNNTPSINPYGFWTNSDYGVQPKLLGSDANSLKSISGGFTKFQVVPMLLLDSNISRFNVDGTLKEYTYNGVTYTVDSYFEYIVGKFWENSDQIGFLNVWNWFKQNCIETFGNLYSALSESGVDSQDSYITIGHPNDYGAENILMYLRPLFDFSIN